MQTLLLMRKLKLMLMRKLVLIRALMPPLSPPPQNNFICSPGR